MIVFDSSPLIHLVKLGKLHYVLETFDEPCITPSVYEEIITKGLAKGENDAILLEKKVKDGAIKCVKNKTNDESLRGYLHDGERESILLAMESNAMVILDEKKARLIARQKKVPYHGTLGLLLMLFNENSIDKQHYIENLTKYADNGWISIGLFEQFRSFGEKNE